MIFFRVDIELLSELISTSEKLNSGIQTSLGTFRRTAGSATILWHFEVARFKKIAHIDWLRHEW